MRPNIVIMYLFYLLINIQREITSGHVLFYKICNKIAI